MGTFLMLIWLLVFSYCAWAGYTQRHYGELIGIEVTRIILIWFAILLNPSAPVEWFIFHGFIAVMTDATAYFAMRWLGRRRAA